MATTLPPILFLAALAALIVGLARPHATLLIPKEEATVILAMDTSRSMLAEDVDPTRLVAAQDAADAFLDEVPRNFKVGLVGFSSEAYVLVPPTGNHQLVRDAFGSLEADGGTAIGDAIVRAVDVGRGGDVQLASDAAPRDESGDAPPLVVLLLSDGEPSPDTFDPSEAARIAQSAGVPVYTVALGTDEGTVEIPDLFGFTETVPVPPDHDTLSEIAQTTGPFLRRTVGRSSDERVRGPRVEPRIRRRRDGDHLCLCRSWTFALPHRRRLFGPLV